MPDRSAGHPSSGGSAPKTSPPAREAPALPAEPLVPQEAFLEQAAALGVAFEPGDVERLGRYLAALLEATRTVNLTAITDPPQAWTRHILDALTLLPILSQLPEDGRVIDIGSGGGVPGVPLAIVMPSLRFVLLEATGKKAAFLRRVCAALGLGTVEVFAGRAEVASRVGSPYRNAFDAAVVRAVGHLGIVAELATPFLKTGGLLLAVKGAKAEEELEACGAALGRLRLAPTGIVDTPTGQVVVLEKTGPTPAMFPRADGEAVRAPLVAAGGRGG